MKRIERTQPGQIEDRAEVDEERVVALPGEDLDPTRQVGDRGRGEAVVVRRRARPDVVGRGGNVRPEYLARPQLLALPVEVDERDAVGLWPVPVRVAERGDRARVVEERVRIPRRGVEPELVGQVVP